MESDRPLSSASRRLTAGEDLPAVRPAALWFGVLGGMGAWVFHLGTSYALLPYVCATGREEWLHVVTLGTAVIAATATVVAWRAWRRLGPVVENEDGVAPDAAREDQGGDEAIMAGDAGEAPTVPDRAAPRRAGLHRFLAVFGVLLSGFFLALILAEGLPIILQEDPCRFVPTRDPPIIRLDPSPMLTLALVCAPVVLGHEAGLSGPHGIWTEWNWDPWVLSMLAALSLLYLRGLKGLWGRAGRGRGISIWRAAAYLAGVAALFVSLISPVDAASQALFSVHMVQHLLLMVVAAPLLILGRPMLAYLWGLPKSWRTGLGLGWRDSWAARRGWRLLTHPLTVLVLHVVALWVWHIPALYQAALENRAVHHLEHASFFFTAMLFWWALAQADGRHRWPGYGAGVLYVFATALQSGALGALITFAPRPWYPAHEPGAVAWNVDPLVDQQMAGVLMWVPVGLVYAAAAVALFLAWLGEADRTVKRRERFGWELPANVEPSASPGERAEGETT